MFDDSFDTLEGNANFRIAYRASSEATRARTTDKRQMTGREKQAHRARYSRTKTGWCAAATR